MSVFEWVYVIGIAIVIVLLMIAIYFIVQFMLIHKKLTRTKGKKRRKQYRVVRKQNITRFAIVSVVALLLGSGLMYLSHYMSMNLSRVDSEAMVKGYFLVRDFEEQIQMAENENEKEETLQKNIRYLSTNMASFGIKRASTLNSEEGQLLLNRYYRSVAEMGTNLSAQTQDFYGNSVIVEIYQQDIEKIKKIEQEIFTYYKVNEQLLTEK